MTLRVAPSRLDLIAWAAAAVGAAAPGAVLAQSADKTADQGSAQSTVQGASQPQSTSQNTTQGASQRAPASDAAQRSGNGTKVKQITVTAARNEQIRSSPDSRSYDLSRNPQASTGSVADALRTVPSVEVSPDGKVSLRGDPNVVIYVDGKPSSMFKGAGGAQALQSIPADQYERVEVMTNPSAAYSPDGSAGIINLISKKTRKPGRWGSFRFSEGTGGRWNAGVTASQRSDKLTLSFNAGVRRDRNATTGSDQRETLDGAGAVASTLETSNRSQGATDVAYAHGTAEFNPDAKNQLTFEVNGYDYRGSFSARSRSMNAAVAGDVTQLIQRDANGRYEGSGITGGLTWRRTFESDAHNLVVSLTRDGSNNADSSLSDQANLTPAAPDSFDAQRSGDSRPQTHFKGDYTRPMPLKAILKAGVDIRDEGDRNDNSGFLAAASPDAPSDPGQTDLFRFDRRIAAAYATYNQPIGRLTVLAGLRVEDTKIDLNDETTKFTSQSRDTHLYPTLHLGWKLTERQRLTASYSERVQRPWANQYDPFRFTYGPYYQREGNPDLQPQQTSKYELGWEYKGGAAYYAATAYYSHSEGGVADVVTDLGNGVFLSTPENLSRSDSSGLELIASGRLFKTLSYNLSGNAYRNEIEAAAALGIAEPQAAWTLAGHGSLDWQATPRDLLQLQGNMSGRHLTPQGYTDQAPMLNLGARHKINDKLSVLLTVQDLLADSDNRTRLESADFREDSLTTPHVRTAYLSLNWTFGRGPKKDPDLEYGGGQVR